jgi:cellulose synthase/poly-beta-1,6-N-acetylglucosamine synthase-like glycosyltransferase
MPLTLTAIFFLVPLYVYAGYPLLLFIIKTVYTPKHTIDENMSPSVTLIVSCFNEEAVIEEKISNSLAIDYPEEQFEILFLSDGSTDRTDDLIKSNSSKKIKLIRQEGRLGKTSGLNMAVPEAKGDIIVFSDANAMYQPDAIHKLVRHFADEQVGLVVGAAIYTDGEKNSAAQSENSYWEYELLIKQWESQIHSVVGGDGAIYAIRKHLYDKLDAKDINDFVNPLEIIAKGYRGIFDREAICLEETAGDFAKEARRKERIVNRSFRGLMKVRRVMNPFRTGFFAIEVISHKLLRWLVPIFILGIAIASIIHSYDGILIFQILYVLEMVFLWLAIVGHLKHKSGSMPPIFFYPYYFLMVNYYSLIGILKALSGNIQVTWSSPRQASQQNHITKTETIFALLLFTLPILVLLDFLNVTPS